FLGPCGVALVVAILHRLHERGLMLAGGVIKTPAAPGIGTYLHRIDFYKRALNTDDLPDVVAKGEPLGMRECKGFLSDPDDPEWSADLRAVTRDLLDAI